MLTGQLDYEIDLEATALGVTDYLVKQELEPDVARALDPLRAQPPARRSTRCRGARSATRSRYVPPTTGSGTGTCAATGSTSRLAGTRSSGDPSRPATTIPACGSTSFTRMICCACVPRSTPTSPADTQHLQSEHRMRHADGSWRWVLTRGLAIRGRRRPCDPDGGLAVGHHRPARGRAPAAARRAARRSHRPAEPGAAHGSGRAGAAARAAEPDARRARCCSSTSTASSSSTTASATRSATTCWSRSRRASRRCCARATRSPGSAATSSRSCSTASISDDEALQSPIGCSRRWPTRSRSTATSCS